MLFVVTVQNALAFLIAWEIMSLSSFFLVIFENEKEECFRAGINYLIAMHIGVLFLISAFVILSIKSGSLDFASFKAALAGQRNLMNLIFFLFFVGFGTKAGFVPFHTWLPRAHPAAPSHVSALMSGVMIKTGIYGILRTITFMPGTTREIAYSLLVTAVITGILGIACSIAQGNLKKLLAYSSVENIGIIGIGTGTGLLGMLYGNNTLALLGFAGALLHLLNHSIFKSLLFFGAGRSTRRRTSLTSSGSAAFLKPCATRQFSFSSAPSPSRGCRPSTGS
jgi:formate hydrogenlyase subunit 3/multisubunit Na+/H+ antiporter MnhD subunit